MRKVLHAMLGNQNNIWLQWQRKIEEIRKIELEALSRIEYSINFTEDGEDLPLDDIVEYMDRANDEITRLLSTANKGKLVKDGIETTIIGKPNVGKSSLLNVLLNEGLLIIYSKIILE